MFPRRAGTVALVDLDRFKAVNDTYGHSAGDELLAVAAARMREWTDRVGGGACGRLGGDEFAIITRRVVTERRPGTWPPRSPGLRRFRAPAASRRMRRSGLQPAPGGAACLPGSPRRTRPCTRPSAPAAGALSPTRGAGSRSRQEWLGRLQVDPPRPA